MTHNEHLLLDDESVWDLSIDDGDYIVKSFTIITKNYSDAYMTRILKDKFGLRGQKGKSKWGTVYVDGDREDYFFSPRKAWFFWEDPRDFKVYMAVRREAECRSGK